MATETLKSTAITDLDATPPVRLGNGAGAAYMPQSIEAYVTPTTAVTATSLYRMIRLPSDAIVKKVEVSWTGSGLTTFTADVTVYYSDNTLDMVGIGQGDSGLVNSLSGTSSLFAHAEAVGGFTVGVPTDVTFLNSAAATGYNWTTYTEPLWQAAGLSSDPGGFFDIVFYTTATNSTAATAQIGMKVTFVLPYN
jgi:hypothetical protein